LDAKALLENSPAIAVTHSEDAVKLIVKLSFTLGLLLKFA
jgi:hypothetical protein